MIRDNCTIQKPSKPQNGDRLCWNPDCRAPLTGGQRKWCWQHQWVGSWWYLNHNIQPSRHWTVMLACVEDHHNEHVYDTRKVPLAICVPACAMCGKETTSPEVDHIMPMNGDDRGVEDCRHHIGNLRVLCHWCHVGVTADATRARAAVKRGQLQLAMQL